MQKTAKCRQLPALAEVPLGQRLFFQNTQISESHRVDYTLLIVQMLNGLHLGLLLFLVASGLTLVFGILDFVAFFV